MGAKGSISKPFQNMGVIGFDLSCSRISGMPRTPGGPRKSSGQKSNANESAFNTADELLALQDAQAPYEPALAVQTVRG